MSLIISHIISATSNNVLFFNVLIISYINLCIYIICNIYICLENENVSQRSKKTGKTKKFKLNLSTINFLKKNSEFFQIVFRNNIYHTSQQVLTIFIFFYNLIYMLSQ